MDFKEQINNLRFQNVKKGFELIKGNTISVFVPLDVPKKYFNEIEINFLKNANIFIDDKSINGKDVWNIYSNIICNKEIDFIDKKIDLKIISSMLAKYTFSMWNNSEQVILMQNYGEIEYGFLNLYNYEKIYSYQYGLKEDIETDCNFI
jgi:CRISPR-associated endonuclease/helicase Cas3